MRSLHTFTIGALASPFVHSLFFLLVDGVLAGDWVKFDRFVLFTRVLLVFVIVPSVVDMAFAHAVFVALRH